jgi:hypothetical protein
VRAAGTPLPPAQHSLVEVEVEDTMAEASMVEAGEAEATLLEAEATLLEAEATLLEAEASLLEEEASPEEEV